MRKAIYSSVSPVESQKAGEAERPTIAGTVHTSLSPARSSLAAFAEVPQPVISGQPDIGWTAILYTEIKRLERLLQAAHRRGDVVEAQRIRHRLDKLRCQSGIPVQGRTGYRVPEESAHAAIEQPLPTPVGPQRQAVRGTPRFEGPNRRRASITLAEGETINSGTALRRLPDRQQRLSKAGAPQTSRRDLHHSATRAAVLRKQAIWDCFVHVLETKDGVPSTKKGVHALARAALTGVSGRGISRDSACQLWTQVCRAWDVGGRREADARRPRLPDDRPARVDPEGGATVADRVRERGSRCDQIMRREANCREVSTVSAAAVREPLAIEPLSIPCCVGTATLIGGGGLAFHAALTAGIDTTAIARGFLADAAQAPQITAPIGHLVCANAPAESPDHPWQMLQALRSLRAVGVDHQRHGWLAVSHGKHVHVLFSRVRDDGAVLHQPGAAVALCLERARLDQEAGFADRLDAVDSSHPLVRQAWAAAERGDLAFKLRHGAHDEAVPVQGKAYERDIRALGWIDPSATAGVWTLKKGVAADLAAVERILHHVLGKSQHR